jgi:hypothetical protein
VDIVRVELQEGLQDVGLNDAVAPAGKPDAEKVTGLLEPEMRVAVTVVIVEPPGETELDVGKTEREKLNLLFCATTGTVEKPKFTICRISKEVKTTANTICNVPRPEIEARDCKILRVSVLFSLA